MPLNYSRSRSCFIHCSKFHLEYQCQGVCMPHYKFQGILPNLLFTEQSSSPYATSAVTAHMASFPATLILCIPRAVLLSPAGMVQMLGKVESFYFCAWQNAPISVHGKVESSYFCAWIVESSHFCAQKNRILLFM